MRCPSAVPAIVLGCCALACGGPTHPAPASGPAAPAPAPPTAPVAPAPTTAAAPASPDGNAALDRLFADYDAGVLARSPMAQSERGIKTD